MDLKSVIDTRRRAEPDLVLFTLVLVLAGIGIAMSYSASAAFAIRTFGDALHFLKRQLAWIVLGSAALFVVQGIDYKIYARYTRLMLLGVLLLLVIVLIPGLGHSAKGSARWLGFGGLGIQPSEFVKIAVVIYLAKVFSTEYDGVVNHVIQILVPMIIVAIMFVLIMMQPDFGTAITLVSVSAIILFVSGFPFMYILMLGIISIPMFYLLVYQVSYRRERIFAFLNPWRNRYGIGYHVIQSFTAFKKGGFLGEGLGNGTQKLGRLPEPHTDFIFAVIAEEAGLLGTLVIVGLFCALFWRGMKIALAAPDEFGRLLAMGITLLLVVQAFTNIAVVTGSLPTTGIPLPFISYGGSSMLTSMIGVGILLNISRYREAAPENLKGGIEVWQ